MHFLWKVYERVTFSVNKSYLKGSRVGPWGRAFMCKTLLGTPPPLPPQGQQNSPSNLPNNTKKIIMFIYPLFSHYCLKKLNNIGKCIPSIPMFKYVISKSYKLLRPFQPTTCSYSDSIELFL